MENSILDKRVMPGMVYTGGSGGNGTYVVIRVTDKEVTSMKIRENDNKKGSAHWSGHGSHRESHCHQNPDLSSQCPDWRLNDI